MPSQRTLDSVCLLHSSCIHWAQLNLRGSRRAEMNTVTCKGCWEEWHGYSRTADKRLAQPKRKRRRGWMTKKKSMSRRVKCEDLLTLMSSLTVRSCKHSSSTPVSQPRPEGRCDALRTWGQLSRVPLHRGEVNVCWLLLSSVSSAFIERHNQTNTPRIDELLCVKEMAGWLKQCPE